jgi:hypothetical protein
MRRGVGFGQTASLRIVCILLLTVKCGLLPLYLRYGRIGYSMAQREDRLDSWKEIAAYLNRDITTVQRWEKREGMPVHRHQHDRRGSVYAFRADLDTWVRSRNSQPGPEQATPPTPVRWTSRRKWWLAVALITTLFLATAVVWLQRIEYFWRSPIGDARFQIVTDFDGVEQAAVVSRDGRLVAFQSDRDGQMDVWVTQVDSGQFLNLTRGRAPELVNVAVRTLGFSPDGAFVTFWGRNSETQDIHIWATPTLGGQAKLYLQGVAEFDWSRDGARLAYHTPGPGDPLFVSEGLRHSDHPPIHTAPAGLHSHFPLWSPDGAFIYFVQGALPDKLDIWRINPKGGIPQRISSHHGRVSHPVMLNRRTVLYLASDPDGSGPWLYSIDVERRIPHRLTSGLDRYTSLAASADGQRLVVTLASPKRTLWRMQVPDSPAAVASPGRISLSSSTAF